MEQQHKDAITSNFVKLTQGLVVDDHFLAHLVQGKVFTTDNVETVMAKPIRAEKARDFCLLIQRKGPQAFGQFINALTETGQDHLVMLLTGNGAKMPSGCVPYHYSTNDNFYDATPNTKDAFLFSVLEMKLTDFKHPDTIRKLKDPMVYKLHNKPRGRAVIFNNEFFQTDAKLTDRGGSTIDNVNLNELFKRLHFTTQVYSNLTSKEIREEIRKESQHEEHTRADASIVCFLTHGAKGFVYGSDGKPVSIEDDICTYYDGKNCPALIGKPKIFIIQACQGVEATVGFPIKLQCDSDPCKDEHLSMDDQLNADFKNLQLGDGNTPGPKLHEKADMFLAYSTVGGYKSYRRADLGSWFIRAIVQVFCEQAHCDHIADMFTKVCATVLNQQTHYAAGDCYVQAPKTDSTLSKAFYFFPGLTENKFG